MKFILNGNSLELIEATENEIDQLNSSLTKRIAKYKFHPLVKKGLWDGYISYFKNDRYIPLGLWHYVYQVCKEYNFDIKIKGLKSIFNLEVEDYNSFKEWVSNYLLKDHEGFNIREYQIESAHKTLKYRYCCEELGMGAGKTLIFYIIISWLLKKWDSNFKFLIVVPRGKLVWQGVEDFKEFNQYNQVPLNIQGLSKDYKPDGNENLLIATYQSLLRKKADFFKKFNAVFIDEYHSIKSNSIKTILEKCKHAYYRNGFTGTFPDTEVDQLTAYAYTGPKVAQVKYEFLNENNYQPDCHVNVLLLNYIDYEKRKHLENIHEDASRRKQLYQLEKEIINDSDKRIDFIKRLTESLNKTTLILFYKRDYGKYLYNYLRQNIDDRSFYYIDGKINNDVRSYYENVLENTEKTEETIYKLEFDNFEVSIPENTNVLLNNGEYKKIKDIDKYDDIDDNFLKKYL